MSNQGTIGLVLYPGSPEMDARVCTSAIALASLGHRITVLTRQDRAGDVEVQDRILVRRLTAGPTGPLTEADALAHVGEFIDALTPLLRRDRFDVVHSHGWLAGLAAQLAANRAGATAALIHTFDHLQLIDGVDPVHDLAMAESRMQAERGVAHRADHLVLTHDVHQAALLRAGVHRARMTVVPPFAGPAPAQSPDDIQRSFSIRDRPRIVLCGGLPDQETIIEELVRPLTRNPGAELVVCDTDLEPAGPATNLITRAAERLGVSDRARVIRPSSAEVRKELLGAALAVSGERAGLVHLEAMAIGVPVIATSAQAAEAVGDGVTGVHLLGSDQRILGRVGWELMANPTARQAMAVASIDRARARYDHTRIACELDRIYDRHRQATSTSREGDIGWAGADTVLN